jgi:origin recognition complex subunit 3
MEILASWHHEPANRKDPVVIVIEDVERCHCSVLAEFINLLSEWVVQIPVVLVMGMATTVDALRKLLPSSAIQHLHPQRFNLKYPLERLEAVLTAVLIESFFGFYIGHKVAKFLYNFFLRQDGTVTSFLRALKIASMEHFYSEPLSFLCNELAQDPMQEDWENICKALPDVILKYAAELPSVQFEHKCEDKAIGVKLAAALLDIKIMKQNWSMVLLCLHEVGKYAKIRLADLFCEALCPLSPLKSKISCQEMQNGRACGTDTSRNDDLHNSIYSDLTNGKFIGQAIKKLRDLSLPLLASVLKEWEKLTKGMTEINIEIYRLKSIVGRDLKGDNAEGNFTGIGGNCELMNRHPYNMEGDLDNVSDRVTAISQDFSGDFTSMPQTSKISAEKLLTKASSYGGSTSERGDLKAVNDMAVKLLERMVREYLRPIESMPFHEIICYKQVNALQSALMGDTRKTVQNDLINFQSSLQCDCCRGLVGLSSSMNDTSLAYNLAQEHGDVINVHDWYESFGAIVSGTDLNKEHVEKNSSKKKRKAMAGPVQTDKASVQARFSKAITELQIVGLLRMPSKRRPDYIQRVAFGL